MAKKPIKDETVSAAQANAARNWLRDHGYSGAAFGTALAAVNNARNRRALIALVLDQLHAAQIERIEQVGIGE